MRIKWKRHSDLAFGRYNKNNQARYYVGEIIQLDGPKILVADLRDKRGDWMYVNQPVESIEHGIALCEAWEATGAYD